MAILREVKKQAEREEDGARPMIPSAAIARTLSELKAPDGSSDAPFAADVVGANLFPRTLATKEKIGGRFRALLNQDC